MGGGWNSPRRGGIRRYGDEQHYAEASLHHERPTMTGAQGWVAKRIRDPPSPARQRSSLPPESVRPPGVTSMPTHGARDLKSLPARAKLKALG